MDIRLCAARGTSTPPSNNVNGLAQDKPRTSNSGGVGEAKDGPPGGKGARAVVHRRQSLTAGHPTTTHRDHGDTTPAPCRHQVATRIQVQRSLPLSLAPPQSRDLQYHRPQPAPPFTTRKASSRKPSRTSDVSAPSGNPPCVPNPTPTWTRCCATPGFSRSSSKSPPRL